MTHGDDEGIVIPPKVAPIQVVVVAASKDEKTAEAVTTLTSILKESGIRTEKNSDTTTSLGWKLNDAELEGIPIVLVLGQRELENGEITAHIRHSQEKQTLKIASAGSTIATLLEEIQKAMFSKALEKQESLTFEASSYDDFKTIMKENRGFIRAFWCESATCETAIKEETKATTRCLPFTDTKGTILEEEGTCIKCGQPAKHRWLFAQAY